MILTPYLLVLALGSGGGGPGHPAPGHPAPEHATPGHPGPATPAVPAPARNSERVVRMRGSVFSPRVLGALVAEPIRWDNDDAREHTVSAEGVLDSGRLRPGDAFTHAFRQAGSYTLRCRLHPFMVGRVDVFALALRVSRAAERPGGRVTLAGRAPAGTTEVTLEERGAGQHFHPVAHAPVAADGSYAFTVRPPRPTVYRARAGEGTSAHVPVRVSADLRLRVARDGRTLAGSASPAQPRARVVLQRWWRERFAWRTLRRGRLDADSRTAFRVRPGRYRLVLPRGVRGHGRAVSPAVRVPSRR